MQRGPSRFRRAVFGAIAGVTAFGTLSGLAVQAASAAPTGNNLAGADRYQTAGNLNAAKFGSGGVSTVMLADAMPGTPGSGAGGHQSDALAVSGYGGLNKYGLLLTDSTNTVPANTMTALSTLKAKNIIAIGGSASVSPAQVAQLTAAGYTVTQPFQGADRYATMQMVDASFTPATVGHDGSGNNTAILASGDYAHLVDALAAGGLAYAKKFPVILTPTGSSTLGTQAQQVITSLQIKHLIVVGGTASIPASQYTPAPSGVTTVDVLSGADRSATSEAIEKAAVAKYGFGTTKLGIAAGATFVGSTSQVQNDGADALSSAPYLGDPEPICVTNGPTDVGSAPKCVSDVNPTTVDWLTGTANLPSSQQTTILAGSGGGGTSNTYSVSPALSSTPVAVTASTTTAPSQGVSSYSVSGLPGGSTPVDIALFPCTGTAQSNNGPSNGAPGVNQSGGTTFTAPGGTSPVAGSAVGEGTSSSNSSGNNSGPGATPSTAYIASVNGVPTSQGTAAGTYPVTQYVAPAGTTLSFVLNSFFTDCTIPVVYTVPSSISQTVGSTSVAPLLVNANGTPQTGYAVGEGNATAWSPAAAGASATPFDAGVISVDTTHQTFAACTSATSCATYNYAGGNAYYSDGTGISLTSFGNDLSGKVTSNLPNTATAQVVPGDLVCIGAAFNLNSGTGCGAGGGAGGAVTGYNPSGGTNFEFDATNAAGNIGDVPAAPSGTPTASFNGCAIPPASGGGTCTAGIVIGWTPSVNQDMSGAEALTPEGLSTTAACPTPGTTCNAQYTVYAETVPATSGGSYGTPTPVGTVTVVNPTTWTGTGSGGVTAGTGGVNMTPNGGVTSVAAPQITWTAFTTGQSYVFYVVPKASIDTTVNPKEPGGGQVGPASSPSASVTPGSATTSVALTYGAITPSACVTTATFPGGAGNPCPTSGSAAQAAGATNPAMYTITNGKANVFFGSAVTCPSGAGSDFTYTNSAGSGSVTGGSCSAGPAGSPAVSAVVTFPGSASAVINSTTYYYYTPVAQPATNDVLTYTAPGTPTTGNAAYAGSPSAPVFATTKTLTDNGAAGGGSFTAPANPLDSGPVIASSANDAVAHSFVTLTLNEALPSATCATDNVDTGDFLVKDTTTGATVAVTGVTCTTGTAGTNTAAVVGGTIKVSFAAQTAGDAYSVTVQTGTDSNTYKDTNANFDVTGDVATGTL